jgi:septal ring factor EnvC (AmiA/AmiB activator)
MKPFRLETNKTLGAVWRLFRASYVPLPFGPPHTNYPLISQQLLAIQEELNNKKSELEQAKEEQSHTQALLKVLQEQVSEQESALLSELVQTLQTHTGQCITYTNRAEGSLQETYPAFPPSSQQSRCVGFIMAFATSLSSPLVSTLMI